MKTKKDSLLDCLESLTYIMGSPTSRSTIMAGLPVQDEPIGIDLFERAASHVNLHSHLKKMPLKNKAFHFPIPLVLLLKDNDACLLSEITRSGKCRIIHPPEKHYTEVEFDDLMKDYTGSAFVMEPDARFTPTSHNVVVEATDKNWFWNPVSRLWSSYSEVLIASLLINMFALAVPLFTMNVYDRVIPNRIYDTLWVLASGIFIIFLFDALMRTLRSYFIDQAGKLVDLEVSATILERILGLKMIDRPNSVGAFANTIESFNSAREFITSTTVTVLVDLPFSLLFLLITALIGGWIVMVPILMLPLTIIFGYMLQKPLVKLTRISTRYAAEKEAILFETLSGIETVKTSGAEAQMQNRWEQATNLAAQAGVKLRFLANMGIFFSIFVQQLTTVLVVIVGVYEITNNQLTLGGLIACSILSSRALAPMAQLAALLTRYHQTKSALDSLDKIMKLPMETPVGHASITVPSLMGSIELRDVSFHFPNQRQPVLQKINLKVNPGEHIGIIGRLGSGKTTLAKLLLGLLQPTSGAIYFDGVDQTHFSIADLRRQIGYVPQDITLFHGTLHDNIVFGAPHADDQNILRAIDISGIEEYVKPKLGSYEANIIEGGKNLSGGQRQVIAMARAILLDPQVFVFDEPTNSMDNNTETAIKEKLATYMQNKTLILMTHRPSLLSLVTRVIIMDGGKIIVDGPKDAVLLALSEGKITIPKS